MKDICVWDAKTHKVLLNLTLSLGVLCFQLDSDATWAEDMYNCLTREVKRFPLYTVICQAFQNL